MTDLCERCGERPATGELHGLCNQCFLSIRVYDGDCEQDKADRLKAEWARLGQNYRAEKRDEERMRGVV